MAYTPKTWVCGETITDAGLNNIEEGIQEALQGGGSSLPEVTSADDGKVLTVVDGEWDKAEACDCGFECDETEVTFFNGSITTTDTGDGRADGTFTPSQAINTDTLTVTLNGTESVLPKVEMYGNVYYGERGGSGPVFTNYPCFVSPSNGRFSTENAGTFTVKMEGTIESVTVTNCFTKAVKLVTLKHLLDGEADGSLRSNTSTPEGSGYTLGRGAVALGSSSKASGIDSHAEGSGTVASGNASHAEGLNTVASEEGSHAEGLNTVASGNESHAEGSGTVASHIYSHAEGSDTKASGFASHAEGDRTVASGNDSHAEGRGAEASGNNSHAQNEYTIAQGKDQTTIGRYNVAQGTANSIAATDYAFIIGNGSSKTNRKNAFAIKWDGTFVFADGTEITPAQFAALKALLP